MNGKREKKVKGWDGKLYHLERHLRPNSILSLLQRELIPLHQSLKLLLRLACDNDDRIAKPWQHFALYKEIQRRGRQSFLANKSRHVTPQDLFDYLARAAHQGQRVSSVSEISE